MKLIAGDCVEAMAAMDADTMDAIVTDPPYGLEFMGKEWDRLGAGDVRQPGDATFQTVDNPYGASGVRYGVGASYGATAELGRSMQAWHERWAREAFRVLKPGGHLLAFGGTRTYHRLASAIEDAGFEIRDEIAVWLYGSGFPKSLNVGLQIDKQARGVEQGKRDPSSPNSGKFKTSRTEGSRGRTDKGQHFGAGPAQFMAEEGEKVERDTSEWTPEAQEWEGWGTALKPAHEPIVVARKPLSEPNVAANVLRYGTGALNVDAGRVGTDEVKTEVNPNLPGGNYGSPPHVSRVGAEVTMHTGRWPANVVLVHADGCDEADECVDGCPVAVLDAQSGEARSAGEYQKGARGGANDFRGPASINIDGLQSAQYADSGGASRFFYTAKASRAERNAGLGEEFPKGPLLWSGGTQNPGSFQGDGTEREARNNHPTVKPVALMRWLIQLVTPPGRTVLDPFFGSGSTGVAAVLERVELVGIEKNPDYLRIAEARIRFWQEHGEDGLRICAERDAALRDRAAREDAGQLTLGV